jgi:O-antigen/teichoic acid export membrane protein
MQNLQTSEAFLPGRIEACSEKAERLPVSRLSLRSNFAWTLAGNTVYAGSQWGIVIALAKLGSPETVGQFALALAITAPIFMFTNLQLRSIQATDAVGEYRFGDYLSLRLITTVIALLVITGLTLVCGYQRDTVYVILAVGLAKAFESVSDVFYGLQQQHERMDRIAVSMMIRGLLSVAVFVLAFHLTGNLCWAVAGMALVWVAVLAAYDIRSGAFALGRETHSRSAANDQTPETQAAWQSRPKLIILARLSWLSLPLGFVMLLLSLNTNVPRYFIEHYLSERDLGFFAAMAYLLTAGTTVISALGQSASPRLSQYYAAGNYAAFRALLFKLLYIGGAIGGVGIILVQVAGPQVLTWMYKREYAGQTDVFLLLMIAAGLSYIASFLGYGMTAARYFRIQAPLFLGVCLTTAIGCLLLLPEHGLRGAALALTISAGLQMIVSLLVIRNAVRIQPVEESV